MLLNKERSEVEVYNDLDHALVNLFTVVRDPETFAEFERQVNLVMYSRAAFAEAVSFEALEDPVQRAVGFYTMINQAISGKRLAIASEWARARLDNKATSWFNKLEKLEQIHRRLKSVLIEARDALDMLEEWDTPDTVFYCDPPYILETRGKQKYYAIEPGDDYHKRLVEVMVELQGMVVLSGYDHPIYQVLTEDYGWWSDQYGASAVMAVTQAKGNKAARTEIVYRNPAATRGGVRVPLFMQEQ